MPRNPECSETCFPASYLMQMRCLARPHPPGKQTHVPDLLGLAEVRGSEGLPGDIWWAACPQPPPPLLCPCPIKPGGQTDGFGVEGRNLWLCSRVNSSEGSFGGGDRREGLAVGPGRAPATSPSGGSRRRREFPQQSWAATGQLPDSTGLGAASQGTACWGSLPHPLQGPEKPQGVPFSVTNAHLQARYLKDGTWGTGVVVSLSPHYLPISTLATHRLVAMATRLIDASPWNNSNLGPTQVAPISSS